MELCACSRACHRCSLERRGFTVRFYMLETDEGRECVCDRCGARRRPDESCPTAMREAVRHG